jgi:hypothetical protein
MDSVSTESIDRLTWPLCGRYQVVQVETLLVEVATGINGRSDRALSWALGVRRSGDGEVLGLWEGHQCVESTVTRLAQDLKLRGLERINIACACESATRVIQKLFPNAVAVSQMSPSGLAVPRKLPAPLPRHHLRSRLDGARSVEQVDATASGTSAEEQLSHCSVRFAPRRSKAISEQRAVRSAQLLGARLRAALDRAAKRRGVFADTRVAVEFIAKTLIIALDDCLRFESDAAVRRSYVGTDDRAARSHVPLC